MAMKKVDLSDTYQFVTSTPSVIQIRGQVVQYYTSLDGTPPADPDVFQYAWDMIDYRGTDQLWMKRTKADDLSTFVVVDEL